MTRPVRPPAERLDLTLPASEQTRFHPLLQHGVTTRIAGTRSALRFLTEDLGLDPAYVQERITTVFVDGSVVDALDAARLEPGSLLALSAAMPGLVGATLRRGGPYAAMRAEITRARDQAPDAGAAGSALVRVKLFNLLLDELGPVLLEHGVVLEGAEAFAVLGPHAPPGSCRAGAEVELRVRFS
jgi:hypothetical protein